MPPPFPSRLLAASRSSTASTPSVRSLSPPLAESYIHLHHIKRNNNTIDISLVIRLSRMRDWSVADYENGCGTGAQREGSRMIVEVSEMIGRFEQDINNMQEI